MEERKKERRKRKEVGKKEENEGKKEESKEGIKVEEWKDERLSSQKWLI